VILTTLKDLRKSPNKSSLGDANNQSRKGGKTQRNIDCYGVDKRICVRHPLRDKDQGAFGVIEIDLTQVISGYNTTTYKMRHIRSVKGVSPSQIANELPKSILGLLEHQDFYSAYTEKKCSQAHASNQPVELKWVLDKDGQTVCCGEPGRWPPGTAGAIGKKYRLHILRCYNDLKASNFPELRTAKPAVTNRVGGYAGARSNRFQTDSKFIDGMSWAVGTEQNGKKRMEDKYSIVNDFHRLHGLTGAQEVFFGLYDGHGGEGMANWLKENLQKHIAQRLPALDDRHSQHPGIGEAGETMENAIRQGFLDAELEWLEKQKNLYRLYEAQHRANQLSDPPVRIDYSGAVGIIAIVCAGSNGGADLYIANVGDCEAVLCRDGKPILLSRKHSPSDSSEMERVIKAGGHTEVVESSIYVGEVGHLFETSRSFGDLVDCAHEHSVRKVRGLCCDPYVKRYELEPTDEFLLLGCDGIWEKFKKKDAVAIVRKSLRRDKDIRKAANALVEDAMGRHATDNLSTILIGFGALDPNNPGQRVIVQPRVRSRPCRFHRGKKPVKEPTEKVYEGFYCEE